MIIDPINPGISIFISQLIERLRATRLRQIEGPVKSPIKGCRNDALHTKRL